MKKTAIVLLHYTTSNIHSNCCNSNNDLDTPETSTIWDPFVWYVLYTNPTDYLRLLLFTENDQITNNTDVCQFVAVVCLPHEVIVPVHLASLFRP